MPDIASSEQFVYQLEESGFGVDISPPTPPRCVDCSIVLRHTQSTRRTQQGWQPVMPTSRSWTSKAIATSRLLRSDMRWQTFQVSS